MTGDELRRIDRLMDRYVEGLDGKVKVLPKEKWGWIGTVLYYGYREMFQNPTARARYALVGRDFKEHLA